MIDKMGWHKFSDGTFIRMKNNKPMTKSGQEKWDRQENKKLLGK